MLGIDLVSIERFENFYKKFGKKALLRYLNKNEIELSKEKIETLSGFYAAKEAISKALGCGIGSELSFHDIQIRKTSKNAPYFTLPKYLVEKYNITETSLSITHEKEYAIAVAYIKSKVKNQLWH
jgi:holo-[acyl-carrier protein] synthase